MIILLTCFGNSCIIINNKVRENFPLHSRGNTVFGVKENNLSQELRLIQFLRI